MRPLQIPSEHWTLEFDLERNPLPMNGAQWRRHQHTGWIKAIRNMTEARAQYAGIPPMRRAQVQLWWFVHDRRRRDEGNLARLEKAMIDGLVRAGVILDDSPDYLVQHRARIDVVNPTDSHPRPFFALKVAEWPFDPVVPFAEEHLGRRLWSWEIGFLEAAAAGEDGFVAPKRAAAGNLADLRHVLTIHNERNQS